MTVASLMAMAPLSLAQPGGGDGGPGDVSVFVCERVCLVFRVICQKQKGVYLVDFSFMKSCIFKINVKKGHQGRAPCDWPRNEQRNN